MTKGLIYAVRRGAYLLRSFSEKMASRPTRKRQAREAYFENPYNREGLEVQMDRYDYQGRRISEGSGLGFYQNQVMEAKEREAEEHRARRHAEERDVEILPPLRSYIQSLRGRIDTVLQEAISKRDGTNGFEQNSEYVSVVEELQNLRELILGTRYEGTYEESSDSMLKAHEAIYTDEVSEKAKDDAEVQRILQEVHDNLTSTQEESNEEDEDEEDTEEEEASTPPQVPSSVASPPKVKLKKNQ